MEKTSKPLQVITNEDGTSSFSLNTKKPISVTTLGTGKYEVSVANAILEMDMTKEYLCIRSKKIARSIDNLDSGDIYVEEDGSIMVVD